MRCPNTIIHAGNGVECAVVVVQGKARRRRIANLFKEEQHRPVPPQPCNPPRSVLTLEVNLKDALIVLLLIELMHLQSAQLLFLGSRNGEVRKERGTDTAAIMVREHRVTLRAFCEPNRQDLAFVPKRYKETPGCADSTRKHNDTWFTRDDVYRDRSTARWHGDSANRTDGAGTTGWITPAHSTGQWC